ncbi:hypothetical protein C8F04DRAFT_1233887 [Mycena alexandri]|uniref:Uncharacterized protein n=1 Tax=Mycena alexandri TaxID=1745969 RepID=A0AAD6SW82_9AGAR|nr:hypothetical protein C8F04DRAFT_1233887 [Mycena alexandri]
MALFPQTRNDPPLALSRKRARLFLELLSTLPFPKMPKGSPISGTAANCPQRLYWHMVHASRCLIPSSSQILVDVTNTILVILLLLIYDRAFACEADIVGGTLWMAMWEARTIMASTAIAFIKEVVGRSEPQNVEMLKTPIGSRTLESSGRTHDLLVGFYIKLIISRPALECSLIFLGMSNRFKLEMNEFVQQKVGVHHSTDGYERPLDSCIVSICNFTKYICAPPDNFLRVVEVELESNSRMHALFVVVIFGSFTAPFLFPPPSNLFCARPPPLGQIFGFQSPHRVLRHVQRAFQVSIKQNKRINGEILFSPRRAHAIRAGRGKLGLPDSVEQRRRGMCRGQIYGGAHGLQPAILGATPCSFTSSEAGAVCASSSRGRIICSSMRHGNSPADFPWSPPPPFSRAGSTRPPLTVGTKMWMQRGRVWGEEVRRRTTVSRVRCLRPGAEARAARMGAMLFAAATRARAGRWRVLRCTLDATPTPHSTRCRRREGIVAGGDTQGRARGCFEGPYDYSIADVERTTGNEMCVDVELEGKRWSLNSIMRGDVHAADALQKEARDAPQIFAGLLVVLDKYFQASQAETNASSSAWMDRLVNNIS